MNVSECEYCGLTHGAAHGLGLKSYMADLGFEMSLEILSDSSAARAFASRRGLDLWRHERVAAGHLLIQKIKTTHNIADILTKAASRETLERHKRTIGLRRVNAHRRSSDSKVLSTVIQCLHVHSLRIKHSSSLATNWASYKGYDISERMWSRRVRRPCLDVARVLRTHEGDRRVDVC